MSRLNLIFQIIIVLQALFCMTFPNIFDSQLHFLAILLNCVALSLKYSPEILLTKFNQFRNEQNDVLFILTILQGTIIFRIIMVSISTVFINLVTGSLILCMISILVRKKGILGLEVLSNLFFPIQTYLTVLSINDGQLTTGQIAYFATTFIISLIIILCNLLLLDFRADSAIIVKPCSKWHKILTQTIMLLTGILSFFLKDDSKTPIVISLLVLTLLKTVILLRCINYQSPLIQYSAYLCEPLSWVSLLAIFFSTFENRNVSPLLWICLCVIIFFVFFQNTTIRFMMQKKYGYFLKRYLDLNVSRNKINAQEHQQKIIIYLSLVREGLKGNEKNLQKQSFLKFSKHFIHLACESICQLEQIMQKKKQAKKNNHASTQYGSNIFIVSKNVLISKQSQEQNEHVNEWAQKFWEVIKQIRQLGNQKYKNLRRYICYSLPQISNAFQARAIYIYYLNHNSESDQSGQTKSLGKFNVISKLQNQIDYNYVLEKTKNKKIQKILLRQDINRKQLIGDTLKFDFGYCLKTQNAYGSNYFQSFYQQTIYQQTLENLFQQFINVQKDLISIVGDSLAKMKSLIKNLFKVNKIKKKIFDIVEKCPQTQSKQFAIQQFILLKYVLKLPNLANEKLKHLQIQQNAMQQKHKIVSKTFKSTAKSIEKVQTTNNNNEAIVMMSGVNNRGNIIYGSNSFKEIMEIKSGLNLATDTKHDMLHLDHLMLPCWMDKHYEVMEKLMIYEKPFHHLGKKYHIKSTVSKNIYEVSFTMHFITVNTDDLIIALDMKYKRLEFLQITKNGQKIFLQDHQHHQRKRQRTLNRGTKFKYRNLLSFESTNFIQKKKRIIYDEMIFGQKYQIQAEYKTAQLGSFHDDNNTGTVISIENEGGQQEIRTISICDYQNEKNQERTSLEKKLHHYRKNCFVFQNNYRGIVAFKLILCIVVILLSAVLVVLLAQETKKHKQFYQFRHAVQVQYYMTDLMSFTSFIMLFVPLNPSIQFPSNESITEFKSIWYQMFVEEARTIKTRGQELALNSYSLELFSTFDFISLAQKKTNYLYHQEKYEIQYSSIVGQLNLSSSIENGINTFPNPYELLNSAQIYKLNKLYTNSLNLFQEYLLPSSISDDVTQLAAQIINEENYIIQLLFFLILFTAMIGLTIFAVLYLQYLSRIYHFISYLFELPAKTVKSLQTEIQQFKNFIAQSKNSPDPNPYRTIQTSNSFGTSKRGIFVINKISSNNQTPKEIKKLSPLKSDWIPTLILFIFLMMFLGMLYLSYSIAATEVKLFDQYMSGSRTMIQLEGKSLYVFTWLIDAIFFTQKPLNTQIPLYINQMKQINLLTTMQKLQPDPNDLQKSLFQAWSGSDYLKINYLDEVQARTTLMETFKNSIQLYEIVYSRLENNPRGSDIDSKPIVQMYKQLSLSTQMIREILNKAQTNYFEAVPNINQQLVFNLIAVFILTLIILHWTKRRLYTHTKILFEQTLSFTTIKDIYHVPSLAFHLHEAERQTKYQDIIF